MNLIKTFYVVIAMAIAGSVHAREEINLVWGFNIGSGAANTARIIVEELNKSQSKYQFILVNKPGAGGTIAAQNVANNPENTVVSMSSSFIIRPYYEKTQPTHNLDNYIPILVQGTGQPLFLVSAKYKNLNELIKKPNAIIGVSGIGSIGHLAANELIKLNPSITIVNFKSQIDATVAAAGKHVDAAVTFYADAKGLIDSERVIVLGYTGTQPQLNQPHKMFSKFNMFESRRVTANYAIYASRNMTPERFKELHALFAAANRQPLVLESYARDQVTPLTLNLTESEVWYGVERRFWREQVAKIKIQ
jgi:hypothetical protein